VAQLLHARPNLDSARLGRVFASRLAEMKLTTARRVLLVDDEPAIGATMSRMVRVAGYDPTYVNSGAAALSSLDGRWTEFLAVVSDVHMSGMDGMTLARRIFERYPGLPVILCSGDSGPSVDTLGSQTGVMSVLAKPVRLQHLADLLSDLAKN